VKGYSEEGINSKEQVNVGRRKLRTTHGTDSEKGVDNPRPTRILIA